MTNTASNQQLEPCPCACHSIARYGCPRCNKGEPCRVSAGEVVATVDERSREIEFWMDENIKSHKLGALMAGLLTDAQNEELQRLRSEMKSSSRGDRPPSISAENIASLIRLEALAAEQDFTRHLMQRHEELVSYTTQQCLKVIKLIEQYTRPDFYDWLLMDRSGQHSDPCERAVEAKAALQALMTSKPNERAATASLAAPKEETTCTCGDLTEVQVAVGEHYDDCPLSTYKENGE